MKVTPLDLRQQKFRTVVRGFDRAEVEAFLSRDRRRLRTGAARSGSPARRADARAGARSRNTASSERNLRNTLLTAQRLADEIKANAENEAKRIIGDAQARADLLQQKCRRGSRTSSARSTACA